MKRITFTPSFKIEALQKKNIIKHVLNQLEKGSSINPIKTVKQGPQSTNLSLVIPAQSVFDKFVTTEK